MKIIPAMSGKQIAVFVLLQFVFGIIFFIDFQYLDASWVFQYVHLPSPLMAIIGGVFMQWGGWTSALASLLLGFFLMDARPFWLVVIAGVFLQAIIAGNINQLINFDEWTFDLVLEGILVHVAIFFPFALPCAYVGRLLGWKFRRRAMMNGTAF